MVVMVVALLVFGPEKLPEMARNLGRTASQLRRMAQDMKDEFSTALDDDEEDRPAPGSGSSRPRAAGALPADGDSSGDSGGESDQEASGNDSEDPTTADSNAHEERSTLQDATTDGSDGISEDDERPPVEASAGGGSEADFEDDDNASIKDDLERLNRQQQDAEAAAATPTGDPKIERGR